VGRRELTLVGCKNYKPITFLEKQNSTNEIDSEINIVSYRLISKIYISRASDVEYGRKDDCSLVDNPHDNRVCFGPCSNDMVDFFSKTTMDIRPKPRTY
jgi:hypothetical protein